MAPIKKAGGPRSERKAAKRKAQDAIPDVPEDYTNDAEQNEEVAAPKKRKRDDDEEADEGAEEGAVKNAKKAKKEKKEKEGGKKEKKEKKPKKTDGEVEGEETVMEDAAPKEPKEDVPKKSKKERKAERKAQQAAEAIANTKANRAAEEAAAASTPSVAADGTETSSKPATTAAAAGAKTPKAEKPPKLDKDGNPIKKKNNRNREKKRLAAATAIAAGEKASARFIVFVGNLPFSATVESITAHFAAVHPISVRNLTQKDDPTKSKGCAFVEFEGYDHMKTCLKTYHHSEFDDGKSTARKINVELTAGGGGNTKVRKGKIAEKNEKLMEQRTRRIGEEEKQKLVKRGVPEEDQSGIHPSRRARLA
ncbi:hypothetical protein VC83_02334 [Pseudogymnoascus destructans]|uniref:RRM domain-containing protein n=1 Tax=Pseudogymnoascus destructans TaxID=655981 RepID=A0A177AHD3_9PEZI|nr:uncharacterized protein VC83_02334 [Pseudogymnoascus destructans]OAF61200.1 hypothetical protein VC83_02334 [Pseudogymnoascus destructans]